MASKEAWLRQSELEAITGTGAETIGLLGLGMDKLHVRYGRRTVLEDFSLRLRQGELMCLLGKSGCGKTSLLRTVAGFVRPDSGAILVGGRDIVSLPVHRRNIGFVHQNYALFPHLTVFENVAFGLHERRVAKAYLRERTDAALRLVHLSGHAGQYPSELSGGMQQRVALARALAISPSILLLDEPLSALDTSLRSGLREELLDLHRALPELTILHVTHDREEAMLLADRIALIRDGRLEQLGTPRELYDEPVSLYAAAYLGGVNVLPREAAARWFGQENAGDGGRSQWIIRSENVRLDGTGAIRLTGTVERSQWLGSHYRLRVRAHEFADWSLNAESWRRHAVPAEKSEVLISFMREDCRCVRT